MPRYIGGELGRNGEERVIEGEDLTKDLRADRPWIDLADFSRTALLRCKLPRIRGNLKPGTRLLDCTMEGVVARNMGDNFGSHLIYVNGGRGTTELNFVIQGLKMARCQATNGIEIKGTGAVVADCEQIECRNEAGTGPMTESVRLRNGGDHTVIRNRGFGKITCRGWLKWIVGNPGATVILWAGTTDPWNIAPQSGSNRPACGLAYVEGIGSVVVGLVQGEQSQFAAKNCVIDPGIPDSRIKWGHHEGTLRRHLSSMDELRAMAGP
jgi:hypothetical protein